MQTMKLIVISENVCRHFFLLFWSNLPSKFIKVFLNNLVYKGKPSHEMFPSFLCICFAAKKKYLNIRAHPRAQDSGYVYIHCTR